MNTEGIDLVQNCQNTSEPTEPTITNPKYKRLCIWTDAELITFLEVYKKHPCLYDMTLPTRISLAHGATKEIASLEMLNELREKLKRPELLKILTADKVFRKATEIKYNFCTAWTKVQKSKGQYKPSYVWYNLADSFLRPYAIQSYTRRNNLEAAKQGQQWAQINQWTEPAYTYSRKRKDSGSATDSDTNNETTTRGSTNTDVRTHKDGRFAKLGTSVAENLKIKKAAEPAQTYSRKKKANETVTESNTNDESTTSGFTYFDVRKQKDDRFEKFGTTVAENLRKMALPEALVLFQQMQSLINKRRIALSQTEGTEGTIEQEVPFITSVKSLKSDTEEELEPNVVEHDNILQQEKIVVQPARVLKVKLEDVMKKKAAYGLRKKSNN